MGGTLDENLRCPACRQPVTAEMRFCVHCGQKLRADEGRGAATPPDVSGLPAADDTTATSGTSEVHSASDSAESEAGPRLSVIPGAGTGLRPARPYGLRYAGFWRRFAAYLIDQLIVGTAVGVLTVLYFVAMGAIIGRDDPVLWSDINASLNNPDATPDALATFVMLSILAGVLWLSVIGTWLYYAVFESSPWQATLGKRALGIRVCDLEGRRISFGRASGRYFAKIISGLVLYIGFLMAAFTRRKQALHDMIADCLVVIDDRR